MAIFSDLIAELEKSFKIKAAQNIKDNAVGLGLEDGSVINIEQFPEGEAVHMHYNLGSIPLDIRPLILMSLMATHTCGIVTQGCYFGFEAQQESLLLFRSLPMRGLPAEVFAELVEHFVRQTQHWRSALPELYENARRQATIEQAPIHENIIKI